MDYTFILSSTDVMLRGLKYCGVGLGQQKAMQLHTKVLEVKAHYGSSPLVRPNETQKQQQQQQQLPRRSEIFTNTNEGRDEAPSEKQYSKGESNLLLNQQTGDDDDDDNNNKNNK
jgi:hypothetical protein